MGKTKRAKTSSQPAGPKLKRLRRAKKRSKAKLSAVERCDWISTTAAALLNSSSYIGWMGTYCSVKLSKVYNWTMLKGLIFTCVIKQWHSACSTHNCFVCFLPANKEFVKAIVGIQKISILFRHICIFPKECNQVTTKERFHRDLIGQCTNDETISCDSKRGSLRRDQKVVSQCWL